MLYRYFVAGTGMGETVAHFLLQQPDTHSVVVSDVSLERARNVAARLNSRSSRRAGCEAIEFSMEDSSGFPKFSYFDVVISALPARYNLQLFQMALAAGTNYCDLGGVLNVSRKIHKFGDDAKSACVAGVPDCGLMPGLGNIEAYFLTHQILRKYNLKKVDSVEIFVGGMPQRPRPPLYYQRVFDLDGLKHLCYDNAPIVRDGKIIYVRPFSGYQRMTVPELKRFSDLFKGETECFISAGAGLAPWHFRNITDHFYEKTVRWPGFVDFVRNIPQMEFKATIEPYVNMPVDEKNPDLVWMEVRVSTGPIVWSVSMLDVFGLLTDFTAMQRTTGFSAGAVALMIARGLVKKGVHTPEIALTEEGLIEFRKEIRKWLFLEENYRDKTQGLT